MSTNTQEVTDTAIKLRGMDCLQQGLGIVGAERFITLMLREPFDYTKWRERQFEDKSFDELVTAIKAEGALD